MIFLLAAAIAEVPAVKPPPSTPDDIFARLPGDWRIVQTATGEVKQDCDHAQRLSVKPDGSEIILTEPWASFSARYVVIYRGPSRVLTIIDGEKGVTDNGDPVLWWFYLEDADHFRFRRYDWGRHDATIWQWQRCVAK